MKLRRTMHVNVGDRTYEACLHCVQTIDRCVCDDPALIDVYDIETIEGPSDAS